MGSMNRDDVEALALMAYTSAIFYQCARDKAITELLAEPKMSVAAATAMVNGHDDIREMRLEAARAKAVWDAYRYTEGRGAVPAEDSGF